MGKVLEVKNLTATFSIQKKDYEVLHDISFAIERNQTVCVVGESGCGKSVTTLCIMQLLPKNGKIKGGSIVLDGTDLTKLNKKEIYDYLYVSQEEFDLYAKDMRNFDDILNVCKGYK